MKISEVAFIVLTRFNLVRFHTDGNSDENTIMGECAIKKGTILKFQFVLFEPITF